MCWIFNVMSVGKMPEAFSVGPCVFQSLDPLQCQWVGAVPKLRGLTWICACFPSMCRMGKMWRNLPVWCSLMWSQDYPPTTCLSLIC